MTNRIDVVVPVAMHFGAMVAVVYGGPYSYRLEDMPGVKLAKDVPGKYDLLVPIEDFGVPDDKTMLRALIRAYALLVIHKKVYVGCLGGLGRTGMFMGLLYRLANEMFCERYGGYPCRDPVEAIREAYKPWAIETSQQEAMVREMDLTKVKMLIRFL